MRILRTFSFTEEDADLLNHLEKQQNKSGYIRELIRRDMTELPKELREMIDRYISDKINDFRQ